MSQKERPSNPDTEIPFEGIDDDCEENRIDDYDGDPVEGLRDALRELATFGPVDDLPLEDDTKNILHRLNKEFDI